MTSQKHRDIPLWCRMVITNYKKKDFIKRNQSVCMSVYLCVWTLTQNTGSIILKLPKHCSVWKFLILGQHWCHSQKESTLFLQVHSGKWKKFLDISWLDFPDSSESGIFSLRITKTLWTHSSLLNILKLITYICWRTQAPFLVFSVMLPFLFLCSNTVHCFYLPVPLPSVLFQSVLTSPIQY